MARRVITLMAASVLVVLLIPGAAAGGGCHPDVGAGMKTSGGNEVVIERCAFVQTVIYVEPGEKVTWTNNDAAPHTVSGAAYSWGSEEVLTKGQKVGYTFDNEGTYPYYCALHPTMVGAVVVGDGGLKDVASIGVTEVEAEAEKRSQAVSALSDEDDGAGGTAVLSVAAVLLIGLALSGWLAARRWAPRLRAGA